MKIAESRIRTGTTADIAKVMRLERATPEAPHWTEAEYAAIFGAGERSEFATKRCLLLAEAEGDLFGFAVGKTLTTAAVTLGELESVVVSATARRGGLGRALCGTVVAWCKAQRAKEMELEVRAGNAGAIALYTGLGFAAVGKRIGYYREPIDDALLMQLKLADEE